MGFVKIVVERKVTWAELWKANPNHIKFLIHYAYDVLPSQSNLHRWGKPEMPACPVLQAWNLGVHPKLLPKGTEGGVIPWEVRAGPEGSC